jgi:hypothetical protein
MNMDFAIELAKIEATKYAESKKHTTPSEWSSNYSAYFAGYMQNVAERESLRNILKRYEKKNDAPIVTIDNGLDDLV